MICKYVFKLVKGSRYRSEGAIYFKKIFKGLDTQEIWEKYYLKNKWNRKIIFFSLVIIRWVFQKNCINLNRTSSLNK